MSIIVDSIDFSWSDGTSVFKNLSLSLEGGKKYGLVGPNGVGKSTLVRLVQGQLKPEVGKVKCNIDVSYFSQSEKPENITVREYLTDLWINVRKSDRSIVGELQDGIDLDLFCSQLSGGEWTRVRLLGQLASGADFLVLDEPTNNLDREGRLSITNFVRKSNLGILVISHDRELLANVEVIFELSNVGISTFGGNWTFYEEERRRERERLNNNFEGAKKEARKAKQDRIQKLERHEKKMRQGKKNAPNLGVAKSILGDMKRNAQKTHGKLKVETTEKIQNNVRNAAEALGKVKIDQFIYAEFPETELPSSKVVFELKRVNFKYSNANSKIWKIPINYSIRGPARLHLVGVNGSGKTTLLNLITRFKELNGEIEGEFRLGNIAFGILDQSFSILDQEKTVIENIQSTSEKPIRDIRNLLAQFLFQRNKVHQKTSTLSGGEKMRAALAKILLQDPAPQLLILDEPTNNLDIGNVEFLESAIGKFQGAVIVVSHDQEFVANLNITDELCLPENSLTP